MKTLVRIVAVALVGTLVPSLALAAKGDRKKKEAAPAVSFSAADKDNDGIVTESEYIAAMKSQLGEDSAKLRFGTLDKNHDGKLSKEEFGSGDSGEKKKGRKKKQD